MGKGKRVRPNSKITVTTTNSDSNDYRVPFRLMCHPQDDNLYLTGTDFILTGDVKMKVQIQKIHEDAILPDYAHTGDSGVDLYSVENYTIPAGERILVKTGIKISMLEGYEAQVRPKSGLALKNGISVLNTPGTVDSGYRGEVGVILINLSKEDYLVEKGKKVAQMVFARVERVDFEEVKELDETTRSDGGFGSTGLDSKA